MARAQDPEPLRCRPTELSDGKLPSTQITSSVYFSAKSPPFGRLSASRPLRPCERASLGRPRSPQNRRMATHCGRLSRKAHTCLHQIRASVRAGSRRGGADWPALHGSVAQFLPKAGREEKHPWSGCFMGFSRSQHFHTKPGTQRGNLPPPLHRDADLLALSCLLRASQGSAPSIPVSSAELALNRLRHHAGDWKSPPPPARFSTRGYCCSPP